MKTKLTFVLLFSVCLFHCSEHLPICRSSMDCHVGFICAEAQGSARLLCVKLPSPSTPSHKHPSGQRSSRLPQMPNPSPKSATPPPSRQSTPPPSAAPNALSPVSLTEDLPPSNANVATDCLPPPYLPPQEAENGGRTVHIDAQDRALFRTLRLLYHVSQRCSAKIWSESLRIDRIPSYFVNIGASSPEQQRPLRGFLLNHPNPPSDAILVDSRQTQGLTNVYLYNAQKRQIPAPGFTFQLPIHEIKSYAMLYGAQKSLRAESLSFKRLLVHEIFHRAQIIEKAWRYPHGSQNRSGYAFDSQSIALALLENRLLARGLQNPRPERFLLLFYAVRSSRIIRNPDRQNRIEDYDNYQEWLEGTAMFVEHQFSLYAGFPFQHNDLESIPQRLLIFEQNHRDLDHSFVREGLFARFYGTGAAIGLLLDRLGDTRWRPACREGRTLYQHLRDRWGRLSAQRQRALLREAEQHGMAELQSIAQSFSRMLRRSHAHNE